MKSIMAVKDKRITFCIYVCFLILIVKFYFLITYINVFKEMMVIKM